MRAFIKPPEDIHCVHFKDWRGRPQPMSECCPKCVKWIAVRGKSPDSHEEQDGYNCADVWKIYTQIENTQMIRQLDSKMSKELDSMKNALAKRLDKSIMLQVAQLEAQNAAPPSIPLYEAKRIEASE